MASPISEDSRPTTAVRERAAANDDMAPSPPATFRLPPALRYALAVFLLMSMAVSARQVAYYFSHGPMVSDLRIFMTGLDMMRSGEDHQLYRFDAQEAAQCRLYPATRQAGLLPFNHLAYELLFYWPVARLPYRAALIVWAVFNLGLTFLIAWLMKPYTGNLRRVTGIPVALYLLGFYPVVYVFGEGQDSLIFLLLVVLSLRALDHGRAFLAGFILALACFKFHLALAIAFLVFLLPRRWRALAGIAVGGGLVVGISLAMVGPNLAADYLTMLRKQETMTPWGFIPWFMPNLRGLLQWGLSRWVDIGEIVPIILMLSAVIGSAAAYLIWRCWPRQDARRLYSLAILTTVLVSYHLHMQDLTMAALPMLVLLDLAADGEFSLAWVTLLLAAVAGLYGYRVAAEPFPVLLVRGCLLAVPLLLLWLVNCKGFCQTRPQESGRAASTPV